MIRRLALCSSLILLGATLGLTAYGAAFPNFQWKQVGVHWFELPVWRGKTTVLIYIPRTGTIGIRTVQSDMPASVKQHAWRIGRFGATQDALLFPEASGKWVIHRSAFVPTLLPVLLFAAFPCGVLIAAFRRRRDARGHACIKCGYNLTGNTTGICPECGRPTHLSAAPQPANAERLRA